MWYLNSVCGKKNTPELLVLSNHSNFLLHLWFIHFPGRRPSTKIYRQALVARSGFTPLIFVLDRQVPSR